MSDTWVASDALGRVLPTAQEAGPPRERTVAIFYFLTLDEHPVGGGPYNNTEILRAHPEAMQDIHNPAWGPLNAAHHWAEPLMGYYVSDDEYVLRKHAQMLAAAGVDTLVFDVSNAVTYDKAYHTLCKVFTEIRQAGGKTPQIAFHCPFSNWSGIGTRTLRKLYDQLYAPGLYPDLWFRWQGKPLIIADPAWIDRASMMTPPVRVPSELRGSDTLGQSFVTAKPFTAVGGQFPTWGAKTSGLTLSLRAAGPGGRLLLARKLDDVPDGAMQSLEFGQPQPAGTYYLEISQPVGHIGWWSSPDRPVPGSEAFEGGVAAPGLSRTLSIRDEGDARFRPIFSDGQITEAQADELVRQMRDFFTFRKPQALYNITDPKPGDWAWLQIAPQAVQKDPAGKPEEISVGVAQNYNLTVNNTAPMSFPGAMGRSFHDGKMDPRPDAMLYGLNFAEQWQRALQVDPPLVFVTGWNEWTAGMYERWTRWQAPPPVFVDQFNEEFSRDVEPVKGPLGDNYYYQLVDAIRRYKGVRTLPAVPARTMPLNGSFEAWKTVEPEFRDAVGDAAHRDHPGYGKAGPYENATGRNDIVISKVCSDRDNVYFYVRTHDKLTPPTDPNWMMLFLDTDHDSKTGWLGYDFVVNRLSPKDGKAYIERNVTPGEYEWGTATAIAYEVLGNELQLTIPRAVLGIGPGPATIDFKWADNCMQNYDWTDFTLNGDAAPDGRFNYRAKLSPETK